MNRFGPESGLSVTIMGKRNAEKHVRLAYNVPPHVGLGWTPYRIIVQSHGCISHCAFVRMAEFKRWLRSRSGLKLQLSPKWRGESHGHRIGRIVKA